MKALSSAAKGRLGDIDNLAGLLRRLKLDSQRAWSEYVPARVSFDPNATHPFVALKVFRRFNFGGFLELFMIENRTYRSAHACGEGDFGQRYFPLGCTAYNSAEQTLLGKAQLNWLVDGLTSSRATWKLMGNQTFFGRLALTFEVVYGHALKPKPRAAVAAQTEIGLDQMRQMLRRSSDLSDKV